MPGSPEITDPDRRALAGQVLADVAGLRRRMADAFRSGVTHSRVVEVPGAGHYIFRTNEADVLREMRSFLQGLE
jgi:pimeloyl-ACP methyl ester carboxylesterase